MDEYLLTDFNTDRWKGIDLDSVEIAVKSIKESSIYGELGISDTYCVTLSNVSHIINDITYIDGRVYGVVKILNTKLGKIAKRTLGNQLKFNIRSIGIDTPKSITIEKIITWDILTIIETRNEVIDGILE